MGGGAWPFLVGGAICLVNSDNERDSSLLTRRIIDILKVRWSDSSWLCVIFTVGVQSILLRGTGGF